MYICVYVCAFKLYVHICIYAHIYVYVLMYVLCVYMYVYVCTHTHVLSNSCIIGDPCCCLIQSYSFALGSDFECVQLLLLIIFPSVYDV